jgi:LacI family transcriptional regulator
MGTRRRPLIRDVAGRAGVSLTTVSLVLNGKAGANIPAETQARVRAAAKELGYRPNAMARGLRRQRSDTIAVISDEIATTPFAGAMLQGAQDAAWATGRVMLLVNTGRDVNLEARAVEAMLDHHVDAVVYARMHHEVVDPPAGIRDVPAVLLDARTASGDLPSVVPDEAAAAFAAVGYLAGHGHRRIAFVNTSDPGPAAIERLEGYRLGLSAHGLAADPAMIALGDYGDTPSGFAAALRLLDGDNRPTALFCFNDRMAMGAYRAILLRGLRVPDDISIVGFDNMEQIAPWLDPPLTTMQLPHYEMGRWAVEHVLTMLDGASSVTPRLPMQMRLPCPLVERRSVGPPTA